MANDRELPFGTDLGDDKPNRFHIDDRMYEDVGEDFEPTFFRPRKSADFAPPPTNNPALVRRCHNNKFVRKEERSLESLRREWSQDLRTEEEKVAAHVSDVIKVPKKVRAEFVRDLKQNMDSIEAFFVKEVAPVEVALVDSLERARQTISLIVESEVETNSLSAVQTMFQEAIRLKTFDFLCDKLSLPPHLRQVLIDKYFRSDGKKP